MSGFLDRVAARARGTAPLARLRAPVRPEPPMLTRAVARAVREPGPAAPLRQGPVAVPPPERSVPRRGVEAAAASTDVSLPPPAARHPSRRDLRPSTVEQVSSAPVAELRPDAVRAAAGEGLPWQRELRERSEDLVPPGRAPGTDEILREHVVPALVDAGVLPEGAREHVVVLRDGERAPADRRPLAPVVRLDAEPDRSSGGGDVHVHIGRVEVLRPSPPQPPAPRPRPAVVDHDAYLARRQRDRS